MIFSSFDFILIFLPIVVLGFYLCGKIKPSLATVWLVSLSLVFYSCWNYKYLPLILGSILVNYLLSGRILKSAYPRQIHAKSTLILGLVFNLGLLGYFKYTNFFIDNINTLFQVSFNFYDIALPLAISFFTFQQIAFLVDCYSNNTRRGSLLNYSLFVSFFPQLIAGPIVHHKEMMPQFHKPSIVRVNWQNIFLGISIFIIGLFKKVVIADNLAVFATTGFDSGVTLNFLESVITIMSYTFQIYFDFSGYTDMALGAALLFNIILPQNFNSPYKAKNIQDFWRRWHMTLSHFLRDYLYVPLGGSKNGLVIHIFALFVTFLLGGLWHGASWNFVIWGALHGAALVTILMWRKFSKISFSSWFSWGLTFLFVNCTWVFFRAPDFKSALNVFEGLTNFVTDSNLPSNSFGSPYLVLLTLVSLTVFCKRLPNSNEIILSAKPSVGWLLVLAILGLVSFWQIGGYSEFLYFQF